MRGANDKLNVILAGPLPKLDWAGVMACVGDGTLIELGVYRGVSFNEICALAKPRVVYGFDWWRGLPWNWDSEGQVGTFDMGGEPPPCPDNGEYVVGLVHGTLPGFVATHAPAAFVHFDMDLYASTAQALHYLKFAPGAILAFDEIDLHVRNINGEQKAFRDWLEGSPFDFEMLGRRHDESWVVRLLTP